MWSKADFRAIPEIAEKPRMPVCQGVRTSWLLPVGWMPIRSQTEIENFFWTFLTVFYRFRSYSVTLLPSFESPFPPVPRVSVVIHVVKNASRQKKTGSVFYVQSVCIVTPGRGLCKWFLRGRQFKDCGAIDKEYNHLVYTLSTW